MVPKQGTPSISVYRHEVSRPLCTTRTRSKQVTALLMVGISIRRPVSSEGWFLHKTVRRLLVAGGDLHISTCIIPLALVQYLLTAVRNTYMICIEACAFTPMQQRISSIASRREQGWGGWHSGAVLNGSGCVANVVSVMLQCSGLAHV